MFDAGANRPPGTLRLGTREHDNPSDHLTLQGVQIAILPSLVLPFAAVAGYVRWYLFGRRLTSGGCGVAPHLDRKVQTHQPNEKRTKSPPRHRPRELRREGIG